MQEHLIPQDIVNYKFHIVGNLDLKQFGEVGLGVIIGFSLFYSNVIFFIKWPLIITSVTTGLVAAFVPIADRPLSHWLKTFALVIYQPTKFYWKKTLHIPDYFLFEPRDKNIVANVDEINYTPIRHLKMQQYLTSLNENDSSNNDSSLEIFNKEKIKNVLKEFEGTKISNKLEIKKRIERPNLSIKQIRTRQLQTAVSVSNKINLGIIEDLNINLMNLTKKNKQTPSLISFVKNIPSQKPISDNQTINSNNKITSPIPNQPVATNQINPLNLNKIPSPANIAQSPTLLINEKKKGGFFSNIFKKKKSRNKVVNQIAKPTQKAISSATNLDNLNIKNNISTPSASLIKTVNPQFISNSKAQPSTINHTDSNNSPFQKEVIVKKQIIANHNNDQISSSTMIKSPSFSKTTDNTLSNYKNKKIINYQKLSQNNMSINNQPTNTNFTSKINLIPTQTNPDGSASIEPKLPVNQPIVKTNQTINSNNKITSPIPNQPVATNQINPLNLNKIPSPANIAQSPTLLINEKKKGGFFSNIFKKKKSRNKVVNQIAKPTQKAISSATNLDNLNIKNNISTPSASLIKTVNPQFISNSKAQPSTINHTDSNNSPFQKEVINPVSNQPIPTNKINQPSLNKIPSPTNTAQSPALPITFPTKITQPNRIGGVVLNSQRKIVNNAIVKIINTKTKFVKSILKTNSFGVFLTNYNLENGQYTIIASALNHNFTETTINLEGKVVDPISIIAI